MPRWSNRPEGSNWGDFGEDDQIGRMNLLTPERRRAAVAEVREGIAFSLSLPLDVPRVGFAPGRKPPHLCATQDADGNIIFNRADADGDEVTCDDRVTLHTQHSTQWDSLAHRGRRFDADGDGVAELVYYNGFRAGQHVAGPDGSTGETHAHALGIETLATAGVQGRGVLVNLAAAFGTDGRAVDRDDLLRVMDAQGVEVRPGDFLLLYTGFDRLLLDREQGGEKNIVLRGCALKGSDEALQQWIVDSGIVAICSDNMAIESLDLILSSSPPPSRLPIHDLCLFRQGIFLGELWYLEELAAWLLARRRHAFLLTAPPLRLPGSVGSPVTPIATV
jgi:kynurenine formamidase